MSAARPPLADLPAKLAGDIDRAGYYPALVAHVVATAVAGEPVRGHFVHQETTFDSDEVRRHITVLVLTAGRFVVAHADDHGPDAHSSVGYAAASTEAVPIGNVRSVVLQHVYAAPERFRPEHLPHELSLTIGWGSVQRLDLEPAGCADPNCEANHGYTGSMAGDDIVLRVSSAAEGADAVREAVEFVRVLSEATAQRR